MNPDNWLEAEQLASKTTGVNNPDARGCAHSVLGKVAYRRGELMLADSNLRLAHVTLLPFPPYQPEVVALWSRVLKVHGGDTELLQLCKETAQQLDSLGIEPVGLIDLLIALSEAQTRAGMHQAARQVVERAIPVLRRQASDTLDPLMRTTFMRDVPENVRLLEMAVQTGIDISDLVQGTALTEGRDWWA